MTEIADDIETVEDESATQKLDEGELCSIVESLVFVSDQPVPTKKLARSARVRMAEVKKALDKLVGEYAGRGIELVEVGNGWQFRSAAKNADLVRAFIAQRPVRLTRAQLETLAIVAYRQPVTRPEMEEIRGVDSGSALRVLLDRGLLKILGRKEEPGRPLLYGTTPFFLEFFGLRALTDLPTLREFSELSDESRALFERKIGEPFDLRELEVRAEATAAGELAAEGDEDEEERLEAQPEEGTFPARAAADDDDEDDDDEDDDDEDEDDDDDREGDDEDDDDEDEDEDEDE
jgi:segregation and condensation protein B